MKISSLLLTLSHQQNYGQTDFANKLSDVRESLSRDRAVVTRVQEAEEYSVNSGNPWAMYSIKFFEDCFDFRMVHPIS